MTAIADEKNLYLLEFTDRRGIDHEIQRFKKIIKGSIIKGNSEPISLIEELEQYFNGELTHFKTPFIMLGTPFQQKVWKELLKIPYGSTTSYAEIAHAVKNPKGYRAVAQSIGANQLALVIPCQRVINKNGNLGGYAGGVTRKQWLLDHERQK
ncbi:methylated-DNA--[protein]-cysteine S-methyltransferase [Chlamydiales bacterium]|nr:methylated-DNA--[protein]-cysteine S-methyltransferase [Chlamydiales bacterium]